MTKDHLISICKYYKGEESNPFRESDSDSSTFWEFERMLVDATERDQDFLPRLIKQVEEINREFPDEIDIYTGPSKSIEQRAIILYCDLMCGKWMHDFDAAKKY